MTTSAESIAAAARAAARGRGLPPVDKWHPEHCGALDIRIARDGTWFYLGTPIGRPELVRLFSTILRRDPEGFVLVTPVEKVLIEVEDAPFVAVDFDIKAPGPEQRLTFRTNVGDSVTAGPDHPIRVVRDAASGERNDRKAKSVASAAQLLHAGKTVWLEDSIHDVPVQRPELVADVIKEHIQDGFFGQVSG